MAIFAEDLGDRRTLQAVAVAAAIACAAATATGAAAERYAERYVETSGSRFSAILALHPSGNAIDYVTTGSIQGEGRRELVILGPCSDGAEGH
jgi:hypothetical protein